MNQPPGASAPTPDKAKKVYSPEKIKKLSEALNSLRFKVFKNSTEDSNRLEEEISSFNLKLEEKYKKGVMKYAAIHALRGSSIDPNRETEIEYPDFTDEGDSVEEFINSLVEKYK